MISGFINAMKISKQPIEKHAILIVGTGSAGIGVADAFARFFQEHNMDETEAKKKLYMVDSKVRI